MSKIKLISCMLLAAVMLAGCKKENTNIESLFNQAAELSTVQYTVQKIIKGYDENGYGEREVLYKLKIYIKAGIDLTKFNEEDVSINKKEKSIKIKLPQPEIITYNIPPKDIEQLYIDIGFWRNSFSNSDRDKILQKGEEDFNNDQELIAQILKNAKTNTRTFFELLLMQNGFEKVTVTFNQ